MLTVVVCAEHDGGQQPSSSLAAVDGHGVTGDNVDRDYITMEYLLQDMADEDGVAMGMVSKLL
jgi:hypothetical protein